MNRLIIIKMNEDHSVGGVEISTYSEYARLSHTEYYTLDKMIERTGGFGRLQLAILLCMLVANIPTAFYAHGLPVLEQFPDYICSTSSGVQYR